MTNPHKDLTSPPIRRALAGAKAMRPMASWRDEVAS